jgi:hypothetical protein
MGYDNFEELLRDRRVGDSFAAIAKSIQESKDVLIHEIMIRDPGKPNPERHFEKIYDEPWMKNAWFSSAREAEALAIGIYNDYLWTMNLPWIENLCYGMVVGVIMGIEKFKMAFGGIDPSPNEFGICPIIKGELLHKKHLDNDELIIITDYELEGSAYELVGIFTQWGATKNGPFTANKRRDKETVLLARPVIIEPGNYMNVQDGLYWNDEKRELYVGNEPLVSPFGYWLASKSKMLEKEKQ